jgi:hypothetical protein
LYQQNKYHAPKLRHRSYFEPIPLVLSALHNPVVVESKLEWHWDSKSNIVFASLAFSLTPNLARKTKYEVKHWVGGLGLKKSTILSYSRTSNLLKQCGFAHPAEIPRGSPDVRRFRSES